MAEALPEGTPVMADDLIQCDFCSVLYAQTNVRLTLGKDVMGKWCCDGALVHRRLNALNAALAGLESGIAALNCLRSPESDEPSTTALLQEMIAAIPEAEVLRLLDRISSQLDVTEVKVSWIPLGCSSVTQTQQLPS